MCLQPGSNSRIRCSERGLSVSARFGVHPTCRPAARAAAGLPREPNVGDTLPSFDAILLGRTRTLRHLPGAARYLWTKVLTRALAAVRLGKNCSCYPRRCLMLLGSGRKHAKAAAAYTLDRLQRWESGERRDLWDSRQPPLAPGGRARTLAQKKGLATSLAREGFDNKACAALLAEGLCKENPETVACLQSLHPVAADPLGAPLQDLPPGHELVPDLVAKALRSFPAASAPGPSGLPDNVDALLQQLTLVVSLLGSGHACNAASPFLCGAL